MTFTKGSGKYDRLDIVTGAGAVAAIDCPKQGIIPHDMVHFAVEAFGFLGGMAAGGGAGFNAGTDDPHARSVERLVETVQAEAWSRAPVEDDALLALYRVTCEARGDLPLEVDAATLAAIRARLAELTARWTAVPVGGRTELSLGARRG